MNKSRMKKFRWMLGLTNMLVREGEGKGGGFDVFWQKGVDVSLRNISEYFMDMDVNEEDSFCRLFTRVYGEAQGDLKYRTWQQMRGLHVQPGKPWLCAGDFNEILFFMKKRGEGCEVKRAWIGLEMLWSIVICMT